jgi:hypothetical protein
MKEFKIVVRIIRSIKVMMDINQRILPNYDWSPKYIKYHNFSNAQLISLQHLNDRNQLGTDITDIYKLISASENVIEHQAIYNNI